MPRITEQEFRRSPELVYTSYVQHLESAVASEKITNAEKLLIQTFVSEANALRQITNDRKYAIAIALTLFRDYITDYHTCTTQEVFIAIEHYRATSVHAESYQSVTLIIIKRFLLWLIESNYNTGLNSTKISKLRIKVAPPLKTADDILTPDELERLFNATKNLRDRALLEVLYDSMGRINEVATLKWKQIQFQAAGYATVTLQSKTDTPRKVPLYTSHVALRHWKDRYPGKAAPEKYVFPVLDQNKEKMVSYNVVRQVVANARKAAGIEKNVTPHIFRHTRITDLLRAGISEQSIKMMAWGTVTTDMLRVYAHLTSTDAENEMNRHMGIQQDDKIIIMSDAVIPIQCKCGLVNPKSAEFCMGCGAALSKELQEKHSMLDAALQDEEFAADIMAYIMSRMTK